MMSLMRHEPWSLLARWHPEFEQVFFGKSGASEPVGTDGTAWLPPVDVQEEDDRFLLRADVPGVEPKHIEVSAENGVLTIRGLRATKARSDSGGFEHIECLTGTFLRRFTLPDSAQSDSIKAHYTNGVLEIEIPKRTRVEAKRIAVTFN